MMQAAWPKFHIKFQIFLCPLGCQRLQLGTASPLIHPAGANFRDLNNYSGDLTPCLEHSHSFCHCFSVLTNFQSVAYQFLISYS